MSARSALLACRSPTRPVITCQAYGSEVAMQLVNAASSISPRRACSIRSGETVREMTWVQLLWSEVASQAPSAYFPCLVPG